MPQHRDPFVSTSTLACLVLQALLSYLDTEAERLVGRHTAITSAAAAAVAAATSHHSRHGSSEGDPGTPGGSSSSKGRKGRPGTGLFSAMQNLLGGIGGKGGQQQGSGSIRQQQQQQQQLGSLGSEQSAAGIEDAGQQQQQAGQLIAAQWAELSRTYWCPIIAAPPDAALPWKDRQQQPNIAAHGTPIGGSTDVAGATSKQQQQQRLQRLAAPCAARPQGDLWLVSAVMSVVDGDCRWVRCCTTCASVCS
jgi:hypothetical protein